MFIFKVILGIVLILPMLLNFATEMVNEKKKSNIEIIVKEEKTKSKNEIHFTLEKEEEMIANERIAKENRENRLALQYAKSCRTSSDK